MPLAAFAAVNFGAQILLIFSVAACLLLAKQALNYLHCKDVIHLDVKSQVRVACG